MARPVKKDHSRKIKLKALAEAERKVGALVQLRSHKFYTVVRIAGDWAYLLQVRPHG